MKRSRLKPGFIMCFMVFTAMICLPLYLYGEGEWWEPNNKKTVEFKTGPNSLEDPHHHPYNVHEGLDLSFAGSLKRMLGKNQTVKFKIITENTNDHVDENITSADGKLQAFCTSGDPCRIFIRDIEKNILYEIPEMPMGGRPFSGLAWVKNQYLIFDVWSNPHYGMHYVADAKALKLIFSSNFPDEFTLAQGLPEYAVKSRFITAAREGKLEDIKKDINSPDLNAATKSLALLIAADDCNEGIAAELIKAHADFNSIVVDWGRSPLQSAKKKGCAAILKLMADAQVDTNTANAQAAPIQ